MRITDLKRTATKDVSDQTSGKDAAGSYQKSRRFHVVYLTKVIALSLGFLIATPLISSAHTGLVSSNPADKETVQVFPADISMTFDEDLMKIGGKQVSKFSVHNPKHSLIKLGSLKVSGGTISAHVKETNLISGTYKVYYRVISADGHPVSGIISFNYRSSTASNEIEVLKPVNLEEVKHWVIHHKWHIFETIAALALIITWAFYRRRNRD
jgi:methionine-rich copper-binding protein CopC